MLSQRSRVRSRAGILFFEQTKCCRPLVKIQYCEVASVAER